MKKQTPLIFESCILRSWQKPVCTLIAFGMLASPVMAQTPGLPIPAEFAEEPAAAPEPVPPEPEVTETAAPAEAPAIATQPEPEPKAQNAPPAENTRPSKPMLLAFDATPLDQVLQLVGDVLGKIIITAPGLNAQITLNSRDQKISEEDGLKAIEAVLAMNNIVLVPMGEKFLRAVPISQARQEGMAINLAVPEQGFGETDKLISQVFTLKYMELAEVQPVIQQLLHGYGKLQTLDRANSIMITDTEANLARVTELLDFLDQPVEAKIETRIYEIRYAEASQIASKLNELIAESQAKEEKPQIEVPNVPVPPGVIRARQAQAEPAGSEVDAAMQMAERGVIRGKVRIIADDRTNILFVISRLENFAFFDRIVDVLDRQIDPAITVRVVALEYAKAEEISGILNEFIGAASAKTTEGAPAAAGPSDTNAGATDSRSQALRDFIAARTQEPQAAAEGAAQPGAGSLGRLSSETKILADKRTNSLLMMGKLKDLKALEDLIDHLDIMLAQVVIEAVIIEVTLGDEIRSGIDWIQKSMIAYNQSTIGPGGGVAVAEPVYAWGIETGLGAPTPKDATTIAAQSAAASGGLNWYTSIFDLNIDAVIRLAQSSRDSQILSTPVIVTTDNTEANIIASTQRPVVTTTVTSNTDSGFRSSYEYRDIGINLKVTPRINPQRMVVMEVKQTADDVAGEILIDGNPVPEITKRELNATVSVGDRSTIVLGGLILTRNAESETKVPFIGDIPVIGRLFKFKSTQKQRSELVVLLTPYVLMTPSEARAESTRLYSANSSRQRNWHAGWSDSPMGKMSDREKKAYVDEWDQNRPVPYTRDLSIDLGEISETGDESELPRRKTLFGDEEAAPQTAETPGLEPESDQPVQQPPIDVNQPVPAR